MTDRPRGDVRVVEWRWGADERRRPGLPWLGIFLVVFGVVLVLDRLLPQFETAGSAFLLAVGLVSLAVPGLGPLVIPAVLVALGVMLLMGGSLPGRQRWMR